MPDEDRWFWHNSDTVNSLDGIVSSTPQWATNEPRVRPLAIGPVPIGERDPLLFPEECSTMYCIERRSASIVARCIDERPNRTNIRPRKEGNQWHPDCG